MSIKTWKLVLLLLIISSGITAQTTSVCSFDNNKTTWKTAKGNAVILEEGAYKGKALKMSKESIISFNLPLQPGSSYKLTAWMRTESGSDAVTMQINKLGKNNVNATTALANWTKVERTFNVSADQKEAELEFLFPDNPSNTSAWIDEITLERTADYTEEVAKGIPAAAKRIIKTDLDITMQPDEKMQWMLDGKLGMFIHWGLYAGPAKGEWYMENNGVSPEEYRKLAYPASGEQYFDAKDFDPRKWALLAKKVGMKYMSLTTQHHDGYALFESKYMNAFTSKQTHNRDFVKEYVEACREQGLRVGLYKTLINWRFPGYYDVTGTSCATNKFGYTTDPLHKENARLMKEELYCQVRELVSNYGPIDQIFWDGGWLGQKGSDADGAYFWESGKYLDPTNEWPVNPYFQELDKETGKPLGLMGMIRKFQPNVLVNPRTGWCGDYTCEEGGAMIKGGIRKESVVEKCMSLTSAWGYNTLMEDPSRIMPLGTIQRIFADCIVRNMCLLLNVGPDRHGNIPKPVENRLLEFGVWVDKLSEGIYGTRGGPWEPEEGKYGFCNKGNTIYIWLLGDYTDNTFTLPAVNNGQKLVKAYDISTGKKIQATQKKNQITLSGISPVKGEITVLAVEINKKVQE